MGKTDPDYKNFYLKKHLWNLNYCVGMSMKQEQITQGIEHISKGLEDS